MDFYFHPYNPNLTFKRYMKFDEDNDEKGEDQDHKPKISEWKFLANFLFNEDLPTFRMACKQINKRFYRELSTFSKTLKSEELANICKITQLPPVYEKMRVHQAPSVLNEIKERAITKFRRLVKNIIRERRFVDLISQHLDLKEQEEIEMRRKESTNFAPLSAKILIERMNQEKDIKTIKNKQENKGCLDGLLVHNIQRRKERSNRIRDPLYLSDNDCFVNESLGTHVNYTPSRFKQNISSNPISLKQSNKLNESQSRNEEIERRLDDYISRKSNMKKFLYKITRRDASNLKIEETNLSQLKITKIKSILGDKKIITIFDII